MPVSKTSVEPLKEQLQNHRETSITLVDPVHNQCGTAVTLAEPVQNYCKTSITFAEPSITLLELEWNQPT